MNMKVILISLISWLTAFVCIGQEIKTETALTLSFGPSYIMRQDLIFSPFVHQDFSLLNLGLDYTRKAKYFQKVSLRLASFDPMVTTPYSFTFNGDTFTADPHSFTLVDLNYQFGKKVKESQHSSLTVGGLYSTDIHAMTYVYGIFSHFGYTAAFGLGGFSKYERIINEKSKLAATLNLPLFAWISRSPYLVNDDDFIENISSHSGFKTFFAYLGDGEMATFNKIQTFDLELKYEYDFNERWDFGAAYLFEFIHISQPRNLLSFRNSLNVSASFKF